MPLRINFVATVAAPNTAGIAALQTLSGAGALTLTGSAVTVGSGNQMVTLTSAANISATSFTVTGYFPNSGSLSSVTVAGPNANTVEVDYFQTVTRVTASGAFNPNTVSVGWTNKGVTNPWIADPMQNPFNIGFGCVILSGTPLYSIQHTFSTVLAGGGTTDPSTWLWFTNASINGIGTNTDGNYAYPVSAIRLAVNGTGSVTFRGYQAMGA